MSDARVAAQAGARPPWAVAGLVLLGILLPFAFSPLAASPFYAVKPLALGSGIGVLLLAANEHRRVALPELLAGAVLLWGVVVSILAVSPSLALFGAYTQGTGWLFWAGALTLWFAARRLPLTLALRRRALLLVVLGGLVVAVIALLAVAHWEPLRMGREFRADGRASGTMGNPLYLGLYLAMVMVAGLELLMGGRNGGSLRMRFGVAAALVVMGAALVATLGRGPWLAFIAGVLTWLFLAALSGFSRRSLVRAGTAALAVAVVAVGLGLSFDRLPGRPADALGRLIPTRQNQLTVTTRGLMWDSALTSVRQRPVFGWGPSNYRFASQLNNPPQKLELEPLTRDEDAHNLILELGATWGIPGLVLFVAWFASVGWELGRLTASQRRLGLSVLVTFLVGALTMPQNLVVTAVALLLVGLAAAPLSREIRQSIAPAPDPSVSGPDALGRRSTPRWVMLVFASAFLGLGIVGGGLSYAADVAEQNGLSGPVDASALRTATRVMPLVDTYWFNLGRALLAGGDTNGALAATERGLRLAPSDVDGLVQQGSIYLESGQWDAAVETFDQASEAAPSRGDVHGYLAYALLQLGDRRRVSEELSQALRLPHRDPPGWYLTGVALAETGRTAEARSVFRDVVRDFPGYAPAAVALEKTAG